MVTCACMRAGCSAQHVRAMVVRTCMRANCSAQQARAVVAHVRVLVHARTDW